jgi:hypothetical protein
MELESIISNAVEDAGDVGIDSGSESDISADTGDGDAGGSAGDTAVSGGDGAATEAAKQAAVEDAFATEHGLITKRPDGRENRIPYSRVKAIAENQVKKAQAEWEAAQLTPLRTEHGSMKERLQQIEAIENIMANEPDRFIQMMAEANPAYARFAAVLQQAAEQKQQADPNADDPMPTQDYDLGDGRMTYSTDGLEKRMAWERRQAAKEAETRISERYKPIEDRYKQETEREKAVRVQETALKQVNAQLEKAKTWHGFEEHAPEILKALQADQNLSMHDAYIQVVIPKLAGDRTKMRQELVTELKKAPNATSTTSTTQAGKSAAPKTLEDIIRESAKAIK